MIIPTAITCIIPDYPSDSYFQFNSTPKYDHILFSKVLLTMLSCFVWPTHIKLLGAYWSSGGVRLVFILREDNKKVRVL